MYHRLLLAIDGTYTCTIGCFLKLMVHMFLAKQTRNTCHVTGAAVHHAQPPPLRRCYLGRLLKTTITMTSECLSLSTGTARRGTIPICASAPCCATAWATKISKWGKRRRIFLIFQQFWNYHHVRQHVPECTTIKRGMDTENEVQLVVAHEKNAGSLQQ